MHFLLTFCWLFLYIWLIFLSAFNYLNSRNFRKYLFSPGPSFDNRKIKIIRKLNFVGTYFHASYLCAKISTIKVYRYWSKNILKTWFSQRKIDLQQTAGRRSSDTTPDLSLNFAPTLKNVEAAQKIFFQQLFLSTFFLISPHDDSFLRWGRHLSQTYFDTR